MTHATNTSLPGKTIKVYVDNSGIGIIDSIDEANVVPIPLVINPSGGKVGVGTSNPNAQLDISGNLRISGTGNAVIFSDGSVMTSAATGVGGGTITGVTAGVGLTGGGTAGNVTLSLSNPALTNTSAPTTPGPGAGQTVNVAAIQLPAGVLNGVGKSADAIFSGAIAGDVRYNGGLDVVIRFCDQPDCLGSVATDVAVADLWLAGSSITSISPLRMTTTFVTASAGSTSNLRSSSFATLSVSSTTYSQTANGPAFGVNAASVDLTVPLYAVFAVRFSSQLVNRFIPNHPEFLQFSGHQLTWHRSPFESARLWPGDETVMNPCSERRPSGRQQSRHHEMRLTNTSSLQLGRPIGGVYLGVSLVLIALTMKRPGGRSDKGNWVK